MKLEKFEKRGWLYWLVLAFLIIDMLYAAFHNLPPFFVLLGDQGAQRWDATPPVLQWRLIFAWASYPIMMVFFLFFVLKYRVSYHIYWVNASLVLPFVITTTLMLPDRLSAEIIGGYVGGLLGAFLSLALVLWALHRICLGDRTPLRAGQYDDGSHQ